MNYLCLSAFVSIFILNDYGNVTKQSQFFTTVNIDMLCVNIWILQLIKSTNFVYDFIGYQKAT